VVSINVRIFDLSNKKRQAFRKKRQTIMTAKEAKTTTVFFINYDEKLAKVKSSSYYDFVRTFEDSDTHSKPYFVEDISKNEITGNYEDNGQWCVMYTDNRESYLLDDDFNNEEEAEDYCFEKLERTDFKYSNESTVYFNTEGAAENEIIKSMVDELNIDKDVAANIFRKQNIVNEKRTEQNLIHRLKINKENEVRKSYLIPAVLAEAHSLKIDTEFIEGVKKLKFLTKTEKSKLSQSLLKGLLQRNNKQKIDSDFWQVLRILKVKAEKI